MNRHKTMIAVMMIHGMRCIPVGTIVLLTERFYIAMVSDFMKRAVTQIIVRNQKRVRLATSVMAKSFLQAVNCISVVMTNMSIAAVPMVQRFIHAWAAELNTQCAPMAVMLSLENV